MGCGTFTRGSVQPQLFRSILSGASSRFLRHVSIAPGAFLVPILRNLPARHPLPKDVPRKLRRTLQDPQAPQLIICGSRVAQILPFLCPVLPLRFPSVHAHAQTHGEPLDQHLWRCCLVPPLDPQFRLLGRPPRRAHLRPTWLGNFKHGSPALVLCVNDPIVCAHTRSHPCKLDSGPGRTKTSATGFKTATPRGTELTRCDRYGARTRVWHRRSSILCFPR